MNPQKNYLSENFDDIWAYLSQILGILNDQVGKKTPNNNFWVYFKEKYADIARLIPNDKNAAIRETERFISSVCNSIIEGKRLDTGNTLLGTGYQSFVSKNINLPANLIENTLKPLCTEILNLYWKKKRPLKEPEKSVKEFAQVSVLEKNKKLQEILKSVGAYNGEIDGDWGPLSRAAAKAFFDEEDPNQDKIDKTFLIEKLFQKKTSQASLYKKASFKPLVDAVNFDLKYDERELKLTTSIRGTCFDGFENGRFLLEFKNTAKKPFDSKDNFTLLTQSLINHGASNEEILFSIMDDTPTKAAMQTGRTIRDNYDLTNNQDKEIIVSQILSSFKEKVEEVKNSLKEFAISSGQTKTKKTWYIKYLPIDSKETKQSNRISVSSLKDLADIIRNTPLPYKFLVHHDGSWVDYELVGKLGSIERSTATKHEGKFWFASYPKDTSKEEKNKYAKKEKIDVITAFDEAGKNPDWEHKIYIDNRWIDLSDVLK